MRALSPVLDSGAAPNLIHIRCVAEPWRAAIRPIKSAPLVDASNRAMNALGQLTLYVRIGDFTARVQFLVVTRLDVDCILGTTFIDQHVKAILPRRWRVLFHHSPSVAFIGTTPSKFAREKKRTESNTSASKTSKIKPIPSNTPSRKIRIVRGITITPMTQATVRVATPVTGLCFLQNHPCTAKKNLWLMVQGVMDINPDIPFSVIMSNFSHHAVHLPKHTVIGIALPSPTHILTLQPATGVVEANEGVGNKNISPLGTVEEVQEQSDTEEEGDEKPIRMTLRVCGPKISTSAKRTESSAKK